MVFVLHQIELDLLRTLPNNRHYATVDSPGICKLRNVLLAYSWHNPSIGYCQVGVALTLDTQGESLKTTILIICLSPPLHVCHIQ